MSYIIENIVRMYVENEHGACLELCPNPDAPDDSIALHTPDKVSKDWFGDIRLTFLNSEECRQLGKALIKYADDFDNKS